jgi:hypothetical protein
MPTIYASSSDGLFLQSVTEQKHQGGLFTVSAEYLRISGNTSLPATIPTSVGNVDVYPENPPITIGTDGFERVNATGYDIWDYSTYQVINYTIGAIEAKIGVYIIVGIRPDNGNPIYDLIFSDITFDGYIFEVAHLKIMRIKGSQNLPPAPSLKVLNSSGLEVIDFLVPSTPSPITGHVVKTIQITNVNVNSYGAVEEVELIYSITKALVTVSNPSP